MPRTHTAVFVTALFLLKTAPATGQTAPSAPSSKVATTGKTRAAAAGKTDSKKKVAVATHIPYGLYTPFEPAAKWGGISGLLDNLVASTSKDTASHIRVYCVLRQPKPRSPWSLWDRTEPQIMSVNPRASLLTHWDIDVYQGASPASKPDFCAKGDVLVGPFPDLRHARNWYYAADTLPSTDAGNHRYFGVRSLKAPKNAEEQFNLSEYITMARDIHQPTIEEVEAAGLLNSLDVERRTVAAITPLTRDAAREDPEMFPPAILERLPETIPGLFTVTLTGSALQWGDSQQRSVREISIKRELLLVYFKGQWRPLSTD